MPKTTLLDIKQINELEMLKMEKNIRYVLPTDLAVLTRTYTSDAGYAPWYTSDGYLNDGGIEYISPPGHRRIAIRPALLSEETSQIKAQNLEKDENGFNVGEYGEYPQTVADKKMAVQLEKLFQSESLLITGKNYTLNSADTMENYLFKAESHKEYNYKGEKYVRVVAQLAHKWTYLSNKEKVEEGTVCWLRVEPIKWLMDKTGVWITQKCLLSDIPDASKYLQEYFDYEMLPTEDYLKVKGLVKTSSLKTTIGKGTEYSKPKTLSKIKEKE